jgi:hypothetical protein
MSLHPSTMMEAEQYDQLATGEWPSWNDDSFNEVQWNDNPNTFEYSYITAGCLPLPPEFLDSPQVLLTPNAQADSSSLGSASKSTDYVPQLDPPWSQPTAMMNVISPISSDGTTWTSPSLEFGFNSPIMDTTWSQSGLAPLDNAACVRQDLNFDATAIAPMDTVRQPPPQPATEISPWDGVQQAPQASATDIKLPTMDDRPPGISSRDWRMNVRPERCPVCRKGHSHMSELKKHILVHHPELALEYGIPTDPYVCTWCGKSYTRGDRLTRHLTQKHGREKNAKRRRKGKGKDGT